MRSWKTTVLGISTIVTALAAAASALTDGNLATNPDWASTVTAIMAGIGLIFAKDANVGGSGTEVKP